jgi:hypothetical protein
MSAIEQPVVDFFLALQRNVNAADAGAIARAFAPELLVADPAGAQSYQNDERFRAAIESRLALLREAGMRDIKALQIDPLPRGSAFALVTVRWSCWFEPAGRPDFVDEFLVDYVVRLNGDEPVIVATFAADDESTLRQRLQLPA